MPGHEAGGSSTSGRISQLSVSDETPSSVTKQRILKAAVFLRKKGWQRGSWRGHCLREGRRQVRMLAAIPVLCFHHCSFHSGFPEG